MVHHMECLEILSRACLGQQASVVAELSAFVPQTPVCALFQPCLQPIYLRWQLALKQHNK